MPGMAAGAFINSPRLRGGSLEFLLYRNASIFEISVMLIIPSLASTKH